MDSGFLVGGRNLKKFDPWPMAATKIEILFQSFSMF